MKFIGLLVAGLVTLALLKAAMQTVLVVVLAGLVWFGVTRPLQTIASILTFIALGLLSHYPQLWLVTFGALAWVGLVKTR